jgi:iron complex outermembrane recepter protein
MKINKHIGRLMRSTMLAGFAATVAAPAFAQDEGDAANDDVIIVTGSRLTSNPNLAAANPVLSVTSEEIDLRGAVRIEDLVNILPQVFANQTGEVSNGASGTSTLNLRGLGSSRTLVLIDGRRLPYGSSITSSANLDLVPSQLVERVDILTGGASAVYGSDAVGGVANFILKRDFEGVELDVLGGISQNGNGVEPFDSVLAAGGQPVPGGSWDGEELSVALTLGANTGDGRGNVTLYAGYETRAAITQDNRSISGCALGLDDGPESFGGYGCIGSGNFRAFGGDGGFGFQQADGTIVPFAGGPSQTYNFGPRNFFQRPSERFSIYARGHYDITDNLEVFADLSYITNTSDAQIAETASFGSWSINCDNPYLQGSPGLQLTDLFDCSAADVTNGVVKNNLFASHRNVEGGPRNSFLDNDTLRLVGGFRGNVAEYWDFELFGQFSRTSDLSISTNDFIVANVQQAYLAVSDGAGGAVCIDPSGGCVPYNPFQRGPGGESLITSAQTDYLHGIGLTVGNTEQLVIGGNIQADLGNYGLSSPLSDAGIGFLAGFEYRDDNLESIPDEISQVPGGGFTGVGGATLPVVGSVNVTEFYSELQVPLITDAPGFHELTFSGQYRYSDYSSDGNGVQNSSSTNAFGLQLAWAPTEDIRFRGQFQRAVRAPNVIELFTGQNNNLPNLSPAGTNTNGIQLFDPCSSSAPIASLATCANTGVTAAQYGSILDVISGQTQSITGGNPLLNPESSDTYTIGGVLTPQAVPGLSLTIDYFNITVDDFISAGISSQIVLDNCLATGDAAFCDLILRAPNGTLAAGFGSQFGFSSTNINIAQLSTDGFDFQLVYGFDLADIGVDNYGDISFNYAGTYLNSFDFIPFPGADVVECAGRFSNGCVQPVNPKYRHRLVTTWNTPWNDFSASITWRYFGGTENLSGAAAADLDRFIRTVNYVDIAFTIPVLEHINLRGGLLNALNAQAPVSVSSGPPEGNGNTYPGIFDTGRYFFLGATIRY